MSPRQRGVTALGALVLLLGVSLSVATVSPLSDGSTAVTLSQVNSAKQRKEDAERAANQAMQARIEAQQKLGDYTGAQVSAQAELSSALENEKKATTAKTQAVAAANTCKTKTLPAASKAAGAAEKERKKAAAALGAAKKSLSKAQKGRDQNAISSAQSKVDDAQSKLNDAQNKVNEANQGVSQVKSTCSNLGNEAQRMSSEESSAKQKSKGCQDKVAASSYAVQSAVKELKTQQAAESKAVQDAKAAASTYDTAHSTYTISSSTSTVSSTSGTTTTTLWNDNKYPGVGINTCIPPNDITCTVNCTNGSGAGGHYLLPNNGRCMAAGLPAGVTCAFNSVALWQCCNKCLGDSNCTFFQHYVPATASNCHGNGACGVCFIYKGATPRCATATVNGRLNVNASTVGKPCPYTKHDPHFRGAHGTRFEFNGAPEKTYCLITDRSLHVNMKMRGYYDTRTIGASLLRNGLAVRTWIRELGYVWKGADGVQHSFRLASRNGKSDKRDNGFLALIEYDGRVLPSLEPGESYQLDGGLDFAFNGYETEGGGFFDVDAYTIRIGTQLVMDVKLRPAHPLLQTPDDAQVHLNVNFRHVSRTGDMHGIMGQTYREGRQQRAIDYTALSKLLHTPFSADGDNGSGFLDGKASDYETTSVLATDCGYSAFTASQ